MQQIRSWTFHPIPLSTCEYLELTIWHLFHVQFGRTSSIQSARMYMSNYDEYPYMPNIYQNVHDKT